MKQKERSNVFSNNFYMLKLLIQLCPGRVVANFLQSIFDCFSWVFYSIIFMRVIFNSFNTYSRFVDIVSFIIFSMLIFCVLSLYSSWFYRRYRPLTDQLINYKINKILFEKAIAVDISCYENSDFYNNYTKAIIEANGRAINVLDNATGIFASVLSSVYVVYTMFLLDYFASLLVIIPVIGSFGFGKLINKVSYQHSQDDVAYNRKKDYVNRTLFLKKFAKEIRLSNIFSVLKRTYDEGYNGLIQNVDKYKNKMLFLRFIHDFLCYPVVYESVWLLAAYRVIVKKTLNIADFVVLATAIVGATNILLGLMDNILSSIQNGLFINNFKTFLKYNEKISENQDGINPEKAYKLEFKNVSFTYEGQSEPALKNIDLDIKSGEKIALVGYNGAGKSTFIKLLMRLYDVTEGEILLNGINIKEYNVKQYRRLFGTVFQDYQVLSMSVIENVLMNEVTNEKQQRVCEEALIKSGVYDKVISLKHGIDTILTKEFDNDGVVLSGGEIQKIAIARALSKDGQIMILDEPSSALDPIAEYEMYETLAKTYKDSKHKMVVLISHRLSATVLSDRIYLFDKGKIIEQGTHKQLINMNGVYFQMFTKQAHNYMQNDNRRVSSEENREVTV